MKKNSAWILSVVAMYLLTAAGSANAALINTYVTWVNTTSASASFSSGNLDLDVVAYIRHKGNTSSANVSAIGNSSNILNNGLGVDHRNGNSPSETNWGQLDNTNKVDEWLTFTSNGTINGFWLSLFDPNEQVRIVGSNNANFLGGGCPLNTCYFDLVSDGGSAGVNGLIGPLDYFALSDTSYTYVSVFTGIGGNFIGNGNGGTDLLRVAGVEVVTAPSMFGIFSVALVCFFARRKFIL